VDCGRRLPKPQNHTAQSAEWLLPLVICLHDFVRLLCAKTGRLRSIRVEKTCLMI
jgi:hypothetical protein